MHEKIKKIAENIFSIKKEKNRKIITVFFIKFKFKIQPDINYSLFTRQNNYIYWNNFAQIYHRQVFKKYEGCYKGKDVVLFATGPSAKFYRKIEGSIHVGINFAFVNNPIQFDYLIMHDRIVPETQFDVLQNYDAVKFCAYHTNPNNAKLFNIKTDIINKMNAVRFFISDPGLHSLDANVPDVINSDISNGLFMDRGGGTVFSALQFILYTQPRRIYLVGCDCTLVGHFNMGEDKPSHLLPKTKKLWEEFGAVRKSLYPDTEIISLNPVNLKGIFKDIYTKNYVDEHSELLNENIEII